MLVLGRDCSAFQGVTVHCIALHCVALCCLALQCDAVRCGTLRCGVCCSALCVAASCVLQRTCGIKTSLLHENIKCHRTHVHCIQTKEGAALLQGVLEIFLLET